MTTLTTTAIVKRPNMSWEEFKVANMIELPTFNGWPRLQSLARSYGWKPIGTLPPKPFRGEKPKRWNGTYAGIAEHQIVSAEDAAALAIALEKALGDRPGISCAENFKAQFD